MRCNRNTTCLLSFLWEEMQGLPLQPKHTFFLPKPAWVVDVVWSHLPVLSQALRFTLEKYATVKETYPF